MVIRCSTVVHESCADHKMNSGEPKLKFLHPETSLNRVKLDVFRSLSTEELILSLVPGRQGSLKTRSDGTVLDGHHRLCILIERGSDIDCLPREVIEKTT
jgi:hypothetical protein